uniref:Uncharacterized protein n=1 Tax=Anguilla anguilla TaxID=7936 RepID=A0A0E9QHH0_ANGAN
MWKYYTKLFSVSQD